MNLLKIRGGGHIYEQSADADDAESTEEAAGAEEVLESEVNNSDGNDDGNESSDETVETTVEETEVKGSEQATEETETSDEEQASETKSSLSAENKETEENVSEVEESTASEAEEVETASEDIENKTDEEWDWDFTNSSDNYAAEATKGGLEVTGGSWHSTNYGMQIKGNIKIPVSGSCTIIVSVGYNWDVTIGNKNYKDKTNSGDIDAVFKYDGEAGKVELTAGTEFTSYIKKIKILYAPDSTYTTGTHTWYFDDTSADNLKENEYLFTKECSNGFQNATKLGDFSGLKIAATKGLLKYNGSNSSQFNKNTVILVPVSGSADVTVNMYKGYKNYEVGGISPDSESYTYPYNGKAGYVEVKAKDNTCICSITVANRKQVTVTGRVDATPTIDDEYQIKFTDKTNKDIVITADVKNNQYKADLYVGATYTVSLSNSKYTVTKGAEIEIGESETEAKTWNVEASGLDLEEVGGTIVFPGDTVPEGLADLTLTFTAQGDTAHTPPVTYTDDKDGYKVSLIKTDEEGVKTNYEITADAKRINDYEFTPTTLNADSEDKTITFTEKTKYPVNVTVTSFDGKIDLSNTKITFINKADDYDYTSTGTDDIMLRNGTYTVSMEVGYPYIPSAPYAELTVNGTEASYEASYSLDFKERMEWDFTGNDATLKQVQYQASTNEYDEYNGLRVTTKRLASDNSKYGKFAVQSNRVQVIANTTIQIPVSGTGQVQIINTDVKYAASYDMEGVTSNVYNQPWSYEYDDESVHYLTLEANEEFYLAKIIVTRDDQGGEEETNYRTEWDFTNNEKGEWTGIAHEGANTGLGKIAGGIQVDATKGKFAYSETNGGIQVNGETEIIVPVKGDSKITITISSDPNETNAYVVGQKKEMAGTNKVQTFVVKDDDIRTGSTDTEAKPVKWIPIWVTKGTIWLQKIAVESIEDVVEKPTSNVTGKNVNGKPDVWDFAAGATALDDAGKPTEYIDTTKYNNMLTEDIMNSWYGEDVAAGTGGKNISSFAVKNENDEVLLEFNGNGKTNHRIRTKNKNITRNDEKSLTDADGVEYLGYVYSNASGKDLEDPQAVYLGVMLEAGDIVTAVVSSNGGDSLIYFEPVDRTEAPQSYQYTAGKAGIATFYATKTGEYKMYSTNEKLAVARVTVEKTDYVRVSGKVTAPESLTKAYSVAFKCKETGKTKLAKVTNGEYAIYLNERYTYDVALGNANGYVVKNENPSFTLAGDGIKVENDEKTYSYDVEVEAVDLVTVSGSIQGLTAVAGGNQNPLKTLKLTFESEKIYVPEISFSRTAGTFTSLQLEKGVEYTVTAEGVDDFNLVTNKISASEDGTQDIAFEAKHVYNVTINPEGATKEELATTSFVFSRINVVDNVKEYDKDYVYTFTGTEGIQLRDGQYEVTVENCPYRQLLTSDIKVDGGDVAKTIKFSKEPITNWTFSTAEGFTDQTLTNFKGLLMTGVRNENGKDHAVSGAGGEYKIPVAGPCTVTAYYYWNATGTIDDTVEISLVKDVDEAFESTSKQKATSYDYTGEAGYVTIKTTASTYMTKILVAYAAGKVDYKEKITVGASGCDYTSINDALDAVKEMDRPENQRVIIEIQPGDYEEMLVVDTPNVTLKNANAEASIKPINKGVDIEASSVRITSYYGHGYAYYSMGKDCKWNADILAVNKENGSLSFTNPGTGTTSGSYWNATVVIGADGFEADGIIFENSFNQYMSKKAADDVIIPLSGAKEGSTPRASMQAGDTTVQNKKYVERAAALAIMNNYKNISFNNCSFIGRQDTLFGGTDTVAAFYACDIYGGTDYIMGPMTAVFAKCNLVFNTMEDNNDVGYITAAQQASGRGYLLYNCRVTSTTPGVNTASEKTSKPGYLGRPWAANTGEAVFYKTIIEKTNYNDKEESLILPVGWDAGLGGKSGLSQEYASIELAGVDNSAKRVDWSKVLTANEEGKVTLADGNTVVTDATVVAAFLGDWNPFAGKDMAISAENPGPSVPGTVAAPTADIAEGEVARNTIVKLTCTTEGAVIYYTTDGSDPTAESEKYADGIVIDRAMTIKAIAIKGDDKSGISTFTYTISSGKPEVNTISLDDCVIAVPSILADEKKNPNNESTVSVVYYADKDKDGKPINPVRFVGGTKEDNLDYIVEWLGQKDGNTYTVKITGGNRTVDQYRIDPASTRTIEYRVFDKKADKDKIIDLSKAKITLDGSEKNAIYTGYGITPAVTEVKVGKVDIPAANYKVSYKSNVNAGKATVIVSADSSVAYENGEKFIIGSKTATFTIKKAAINKAEQITVTAKDIYGKEFGKEPYSYRGVDIIEIDDLSVVSSGGRTLREGVDYTVTYKNNRKAGKATATIKGIGNNVSGSLNIPFTIKPLDIGIDSEYKISTTYDSLRYSPNGAKLGWIRAYNDAGDEIYLEEGVDFKVSYTYEDKKTKKAGTKVTFTGQGTGACTGAFNNGDTPFTIQQAYFNYDPYYIPNVYVSKAIIVDITKGKLTGDKLKKALEKAVVVNDRYGKLKLKKDYVIDDPNEKDGIVTIRPSDATNYVEDDPKISYYYDEAKNIAKLKTVAFDKNYTLYYDGRNPVELTADDISLLVDGDHKLVLDTDVEIVEGSYKNNYKTGTASVTIRGISENGYYGTKIIKFKIKEA